jgi:hypothetical protein
MAPRTSSTPRTAGHSQPAPPRPAALDLPPGWEYNPASWSQRLPIIGLALLGFGIAS